MHRTENYCKVGLDLALLNELAQKSLVAKQMQMFRGRVTQGRGTSTNIIALKSNSLSLMGSQGFCSSSWFMCAMETDSLLRSHWFVVVCLYSAGADTPVYLALLQPDVTSPRGDFLSERKIVQL